MFKSIKSFFLKKEIRLNPKDIKPGDTITIEWSKIANGIGDVTCLNNDIKTKKLLINVRWSNAKEAGVDEIEQKILSYNSKELKNFHLLNSYKINLKPKDNIGSLEKELQEAIENEEYEKADELQKKIKKLKK